MAARCDTLCVVRSHFFSLAAAVSVIHRCLSDAVVYRIFSEETSIAAAAAATTPSYWIQYYYMNVVGITNFLNPFGKTLFIDYYETSAPTKWTDTFNEIWAASGREYRASNKKTKQRQKHDQNQYQNYLCFEKSRSEITISNSNWISDVVLFPFWNDKREIFEFRIIFAVSVLD